MARHFARLKLTLLRNGLRIGGWQQVVGLAAAVLFALPLAAGGFLALALLRAASAEVAEIVAVLGFVLLFLAWAVLPLLTFTADGSLDPAKLVLLPLRPRQLAVGLFVASCIGVAPLATLAALAGAVVGFAPAGPGLLVVIVAVLLELALCVLVARALTTALSRWLRSRRVRDLAIVVASLGALTLNLTFQILVRVAHPASIADLDWLRSLAGALGWLPPGLAARAMAQAARGGLALASLELLGAAAAALLLGWWWYASLERVLSTVEPAGRPQRVAGAEVGLLPRGVRRLLPLDQRGAVAAKDLRYFARHPRLRVLWVTTALFSAVLPAFLLLTRNGSRQGAALGALAGLYVLNSSALNQFGPDGPAYWTNVAAGRDPRGDLVGKNLALALPGFALVAVVAMLLAALGGGWVYLPVTLCLTAGALGVLLGVADFVSVRFPFPVTTSSSNVLASPPGAGAGCMVGLVQLLAMAVEGAALAPLGALLAVGIALWRPALVVLCLVAPPYGYVLWRLGARAGAAWLADHQPELLAALSPRRGG